MKTQYGFVVSDLHVGSYYGLCPPIVQLPKGGIYRPNPGQKYLWTVWKRILRRLPDKLDFVIFNGDLIDGGQWKEGGRGLIITSTKYQRDACKEVIHPLLDRVRWRRKKDGTRWKAIHVARGTRYHEDKDDMEEFAEDIGAVFGRDGIACRPVVRVRAKDVYVDAWHKISGAWIYTTTALQREHRFDKEAAEKKGYSADLIIGGHNHTYNCAGGWGWSCVTLPSMEVQTDWAEEKRPNLWIPDLGGVLIQLHLGAKAKGLQCVDWEPIIYPHPLPEVFDL